MTKLYQKNELSFALIWIGIYVVSLSLADSLSMEVGIAKVFTAPLCILMTLFLFFWIKKTDLKEKYGLVSPCLSASHLLYYIPLVLMATTNLWSGFQLNLSITETLLFVISMICVGFLEEILFRGFLFKALSKDNLKQAILISSITFGIGHFVNLLNGAELVPTLMQIGYAISAGYLFTILFLKTGSLVPCILAHSTINSLSCFSVERTAFVEMAASLFLMVVPLIYVFYLQNKRP